jgi:hypothetical protein
MKTQSKSKSLQSNITSTPCTCAVRLSSQIGGTYIYTAMECVSGNLTGMYSSVEYPQPLGCGQCSAPRTPWCVGDPPPLTASSGEQGLGIFMNHPLTGENIGKAGIRNYHDRENEFPLTSDYTRIVDFFDCVCEIPDSGDIYLRLFVTKTALPDELSIPGRPRGRSLAPLYTKIGFQTGDAVSAPYRVQLRNIVAERSFVVALGIGQDILHFDVLTKDTVTQGSAVGEKLRTQRKPSP